MKGNLVKILLLLLASVVAASQHGLAGVIEKVEKLEHKAVDDVLKVFDLDFDDLVVEDGENWVERYYIKHLNRCDLKFGDGYFVQLHDLSKNIPPDYSYYDPVSGFQYFFNVCRNALMTCEGKDDGIVVQFNNSKCKFFNSRPFRGLVHRLTR